MTPERIAEHRAGVAELTATGTLYNEILASIITEILDALELAQSKVPT